MQTHNFISFFKLRNGIHVLTVSGVFMAVCGIGLYQGWKLGSISGAQPAQLVAGVMIIAAVLFTVIFVVPYLSYNKFVNEGSALAKDWKYFVRRRSKEFLAGHRYVKVSVIIKPAADATHEHRQVAGKFLQQWEKDAASLHRGTFKKGRPDTFKISSNTISGHVAIGNGMGLLMDKLTRIAEMLRMMEGKAQVIFSFQNETTFDEDLTPSPSEEAYERELDRKWREN